MDQLEVLQRQQQQQQQQQQEQQQQEQQQQQQWVGQRAIVDYSDVADEPPPFDEARFETANNNSNRNNGGDSNNSNNNGGSAGGGGRNRRNRRNKRKRKGHGSQKSVKRHHGDIEADGDEYEYKKEAGAPGAPGDAGLAGRPAFPLSSEVGSMQGDSPGDAYLRLVMMQSSAMPKVFGTPLSTSTNDPIRSHSTVNTIDETSSATGKWQADFVKLFNNIRTSMEHRILNVQDFQASPPSSTSSKRVIPDPRTLFKRITQKNHMSRSEDIIATVVSMERQSVMAVIELSVGWIKEHQRLDYGHAQWLFYLLASLDDVLTSSQVSALRELALASNSILNQLHNHNLASEIASDLHREEASARTIVTIISRVFRQLDIVL